MCLASPWVPTSVVPLATPAPEAAQSEQRDEVVDTQLEGTAGAQEGTLSQVSPPSPATTTVPSDAFSGFLCQHCQQYNILRPAGDTWYTVTAGRSVGVFRGWYFILFLSF
jgi:hypothetical protein